MSEQQRTPESIIAGYLASAAMLGEEFGRDIHPGYAIGTARVVIKDLAEHGFRIVTEDDDEL